MTHKRTTIRPADLLTQPLVHIASLSDIWRLGLPTKRNFNKNVVDAVQIYKADDPTWHTTTWHSANWLRKNGYKLYHEQPLKFAHRPLKGYEVYESNTYGRLHEPKEYSFGVFAGHTPSHARAQVARERQSGGIDNPWPFLKVRRVHGPKEDEAIEAFLDRRKHWKDTAKFARLQAECDEWNARWPVGTTVHLEHLKSTGRDWRTHTRTPAWVPSLNGIMVGVEGHSGGFPLDEITVELPPSAPEAQPRIPIGRALI